ncbi:unnamed protein product [Caenorhabditis bovis]|uniref:Glycosyltransferase family 92 protein n=1 Tax=Caenorhabditis bovis TaxID=2654633 RepID=A0A8S1F1G8_9PELO|nr:unnamed protein product [Caenorhabditis bovis]
MISAHPSSQINWQKLSTTPSSIRFHSLSPFTSFSMALHIQMGYSRSRRARNQLVIMFIVLACLTSLYVLLLKIRRMIHLSQMDENSLHSATINDVIYYNQSFTRRNSIGSKPELALLMTSHIHNFDIPMTCKSTDGYYEETSTIRLTKIGDSLMKGSCVVVEDPISMTIKLDDFQVQIETPSKPPEFANDDHVICVSHLVLYEDGATVLSLLKHFKSDANKILIYASSISDDLFRTIEEFSDNVQIVPWMLPENRKHDEFDVLKLNPTYAAAAIEASLAHCFLTYAPTVRKLTLIDLAELKFNSAPFATDFQLNKNLSSLVNSAWRIEQLVTYKVAINSQNEIVLSEKCFVKASNNWDDQCGPLSGSPNLNSPVRSIYIPKVIQYDNLSMYADALGRCTSYKSVIDDHQKLMKFEFELENRVASADVCEIELLRNNFDCRVAMDYNKKMFRRRTRLLVTRKRAFLRFHDGCHL